MRRVLTSLLPKVGQKIEIEPAEAKHLVTVLRVREGEVVEFLDGLGKKAQAKIVFHGKEVMAEGMTDAETNPKLNALPIHLHMAILKGEAMEWVIEKAVELGVRSLTPVTTAYTVVQVQKKGADTFTERWQKIANQALKQCGRLESLQILPPQGFEETLINHEGLMFWLDETLASNADASQYLSAALHQQPSPETTPISLLIGPEGGFSPAEKERLLQNTLHHHNMVRRAHLGPLILRAETAALMAISLVAGEIYGKADTQNKNTI